MCQPHINVPIGYKKPYNLGIHHRTIYIASYNDPVANTALGKVNVSYMIIKNPVTDLFFCLGGLTVVIIDLEYDV